MGGALIRDNTVRGGGRRKNLIYGGGGAEKIYGGCRVSQPGG